MHRSTPHFQNGLTLLELTVVLLILIGLGGLMLPFFGGTSHYAKCTATEASMRAIRDAIAGSFEQPGYFEDMGGLPNTLGDLISLPAGARTFNPITRRGWRGPYLNTGINDAFGLNPIILYAPNTQSARLVSRGADQNLQDIGVSLDADPRGDDRILFLFMPDPKGNLSEPCRGML